MGQPQLHEVTAAALNLRDQPGKHGRVLAVLKQRQPVVSTAPAVGGWLAVSAAGVSGFVSAAFLRPLAAVTPAPVPVAVPMAVPVSAPVAAAPAVDVNLKDRDLARLHPRMREAVQGLLQQFAAEGLPFRVFEAWRTPERQAWLYAQGRTRPGSKVTGAEPWQSFHQYGMAVDFVLFEGGRWSWDDSGPRRAHWQRLRALVQAAGLRSLSWEAPHAEWPTTLTALRQAQWPDGSDDAWEQAMELTVARWNGSGGSGAPPVVLAERPALPADVVPA